MDGDTALTKQGTSRRQPFPGSRCLPESQGVHWEVDEEVIDGELLLSIGHSSHEGHDDSLHKC